MADDTGAQRFAHALDEPFKPFNSSGMNLPGEQVQQIRVVQAGEDWMAMMRVLMG